MFILGPELFASRLTEMAILWLRNRRLGPETADSLAKLDEINLVEQGIAANRVKIERLSEEYEALRVESKSEAEQKRAKARAQNPGWWRRNADALVVNLISGLIFLVPGGVVGYFIAVWLA